MGDLDKSIQFYRKAIILDRFYADVHNNLGVAYRRQGRLDDAIARYSEALRLRPDYAVVHNHLESLIYGLDSMKKPGTGRKVYFKSISANLTTHFNALNLKINLINEKLIKHDLV